MMPLWRSCFRAPTISVALPNLFGWNCEERTIRISPLLIGMLDRTEIEERMSEAENALAIVIGGGTEAGDTHVAGHEHAGDRIAWLKRVLPAFGRLGSRKARPLRLEQR